MTKSLHRRITFELKRLVERSFMRSLRATIAVWVLYHSILLSAGMRSQGSTRICPATLWRTLMSRSWRGKMILVYITKT